MAVLVEAISVVVKCESIVKNFVGGTEAFFAALPNKTLCSDGELACVNFMVPADVQKYVQYLISHGLLFKDGEKPIDIIVVDQMRGITTICDWADFGQTDWANDPGKPVSVCCARPTKVSHVVVPEGWSFDKSLSANYKYINGENIPKNLKFHRREGNLDILYDENTKQEFFVRRS